MSQYKIGTSNVTNASDKVYITGDGVDLAANAAIGQTWKRKDENAIYQILDVDSDVDGEFLKISPVYQGVTATGVEYQITRDYTPNKSFTEINAGDVDWPYHLTQGVIRKLDTLLADSATDYRKIQRFYLGGPEQDREFGEYELAASTEIVELTVAAEAPPLVTIGLDLAIKSNGVWAWQSTGLTLPAGQYSNPVIIAKNGVAGDRLKLKFTSVQGGDFPGQNYTVYVKYKDTSILEKRYTLFVAPGMAEDGRRIGRGFKPAVNERFFCGMITAQSPPLGADLKIALMHQDIQKSQEMKLTAGSPSEYTAFAQLDCLTTEIIDTIITQKGSDFPGGDITVTLYSYKIT